MIFDNKTFHYGMLIILAFSWRYLALSVGFMHNPFSFDIVISTFFFLEKSEKIYLFLEELEHSHYSITLYWNKVVNSCIIWKQIYPLFSIIVHCFSNSLQDFLKLLSYEYYFHDLQSSLFFWRHMHSCAFILRNEWDWHLFFVFNAN